VRRPAACSRLTAGDDHSETVLDAADPAEL